MSKSFEYMRQIIFLLIFVLSKPLSCKSDSEEKEKCDHLSAAGALAQCDENVLTEYLAEIEITCPENLVGLSVGNFENLCRRIYEQLQKFHEYFQTCKISEDESLYISLLKGIRILHKKICNDPVYARRFELYFPCLHELRNDFEGCNGPLDWYEGKDRTQFCKTYKHVTDCYYIKTAKVCGIDAAKTIKELLTDVVNSITIERCGEVLQDPNVKDPMPESYLCGKALLDLMRRLDDFKGFTNKKN